MVLFSDRQAGFAHTWMVTGLHIMRWVAYHEVGCFLHTSNLLQEPSEDLDTATLWTCDLELRELKESLIHLKSDFITGCGSSTSVYVGMLIN